MKSDFVVYTYSQCDTCRKAVKWLKENEVSFEERPIRETPPTVVELKRVLTSYQGELRKLFNTSGRDYRDQKLGDRIDTLGEREALELLSKNGNLVKRPFVVGKSGGWVGFDAKTWSERVRAGS